MTRRALLPLLLGVGLSLAALPGCPAFLVDRGEIVEPTSDIAPPPVSRMPRADAYVELAAKWRRTTRVGIGGHAELTLIEPGLAAAEVAHEAAIQSAGDATVADMLLTRWPVLFGVMRDRFPIDIEWRFDEQFIGNRRILDPEGWTFTLISSTGARFAPLGTAVLRQLPAPQDGAWVGAVRLWFPWLDPERRTQLLAGETKWVQLVLRHPSGVGDATWRFSPSW